VIVRIFLDFYWREISFVWGYAFDILFAGAAVYHYRNRINLKLSGGLFHGLVFAAALGCGFLICQLAILGLMKIRFDLKSPLVIFSLLIVAPILEEILFRFALWEPIKDLFEDTAVTNFITAVLFSLAHYAAIRIVDFHARDFVVFQTVYTFALALTCGWARSRTGSIASSILLHFAFNLGFFVGSKILLV
jgi:membrane protease YdiL (CAAX protease family)